MTSEVKISPRNFHFLCRFSVFLFFLSLAVCVSRFVAFPYGSLSLASFFSVSFVRLHSCGLALPCYATRWRVFWQQFVRCTNFMFFLSFHIFFVGWIFQIAFSFMVNFLARDKVGMDACARAERPITNHNFHDCFRRQRFACSSFEAALSCSCTFRSQWLQQQ